MYQNDAVKLISYLFLNRLKNYFGSMLLKTLYSGHVGLKNTLQSIMLKVRKYEEASSAKKTYTKNYFEMSITYCFQFSLHNRFWDKKMKGKLIV